MQVTAAQIRKSVNAKYVLWDGEVIARVMMHTGAHGFHSAAIVVTGVDDPIETLSWSGYGCKTPGVKFSDQDMLEWVAEKLTELSTGTGLNEGAVGTVEGLLQA